MQVDLNAVVFSHHEGITANSFNIRQVALALYWYCFCTIDETDIIDYDDYRGWRLSGDQATRLVHRHGQWQERYTVSIQRDLLRRIKNWNMGVYARNAKRTKFDIKENVVPLEFAVSAFDVLRQLQETGRVHICLLPWQTEAQLAEKLAKGVMWNRQQAQR